MEKSYALSFMKRISLAIGLFAMAQVFCYQATAQQFTAGRLVVERVGTGAGQTSAGTQIFLDEYTISGAAGVSILLPTVNASPVNQTVESGVATSAGFITRSQDGKYIMVPGYDAAVGTPAVTSTIANKVITRVDGSGNFGSTVITDATAFSGNSFRGVASNDGSGYWLAGAGNGPVYVTHSGSTTPVAGTEVSTTVTDNRAAFIFNSQVFTSTGVGPSTGVYSVGSGLPTTSGNLMASSVNTGATGDPNQFVIVNNGIPVMYVADYANKLVRKYFALWPTWYFAGSTTVTLGGVATGFYGITANVTGSTVHLYLTTTNIIGSNSRIVTFDDPTSASTTISGLTPGTTIAGPTVNTAFHGISFAPFNVSSISSASPFVCSGTSTTITINGTPGTSVIYKIGAVPQPAVTIGVGGTYTFSTGPLLASTTYTVISATDASMTQTYAYGVIVNVNPLPTISISGSPLVCSGTPTTLTGSGAVTYTWAPGATLSATTGNPVTATPISTTTYTMTGTDINGCVNRAIKTITTNPAPLITVSPSGAICNGFSTVLTASGGITYSWSPATGLPVTTGHIVTASPTTTTTYTVTGTNPLGCSSTAVVTVTVNPLPTIVPSPDVTICAGLPAGLSAAGAVTYSWSPATALSATTGSSVTANPVTSTTYTITGTDANGCKNTAPLFVSVNPLPPVTVNPGGAICIGASVGVLTASGAIDYVWSPGTGLSATTGNSVIASPSVTTSYTVTGTDGNGCIKSAVSTVTVNPLPIISTGTAVAICTGSSTVLAASGGVSYTWSPGFGLSATTGNSVVANPTSTTTYTITGTDANGCVNTITNTVMVNSLPVLTTSPDVTICNGQSTGLSVSGASTYLWSPSAGLTPIVGSAVSANPSSTTTYTVAGTDVNGCVGHASILVSVNALPVISAGPPVDQCAGLSTVLTATGAVTYTWGPASTLSSTVGSSVTASPTTTTTYTITGTDANGCVNTGFATVNVFALPFVAVTSSTGAMCIGSTTGLTAVGAITYAWSPATALSATTGNSITANPTTTTSYTVVGTNSHGCINTASITVTVYPLPVVSAGSNVAICSGALTTLTGSGGGTYSWAPSAGLSITTGSSVLAHPAATTTYTLTVINLCVNRATVTVTVNPLPTITASGATYCMGSSGVLTASGGATYTWTPASGLSATTGSSVTANPSVNMVYSITGTDINGCVNHTTTNVNVNLIPTIGAGLPVTYCTGGSATLSATGGVSYVWSPSTGLSATTGSSVIASPTTTTTYSVIGTSPYGCVNSSSVRVNVNPLPAVFTVTGGGTFCAGGLGVPVGLSGSQGPSVNYVLYCNGIFTGITRTGIGSSLDFGHPGSAGYYTVIATDLVTGCHDTMSGGVVITINPVPIVETVTGGGIYCPGGVGGHIGLSASVNTVDYQLYRNGIAFGSPVPGVGYALDFGLHDTGTYTVSATFHGTTCSANMTGSAVVSMYPLPALFAVTGGGAYCSGGSGIHIGLIGSQIGSRYQVYLVGGGASGTSLIGLNAPLDFGFYTSPGVYKVVATGMTSGCIDTMTGSVTVSINPTPVITGPSMVLQHNVITLAATPTGGTWASQNPLIVATVGTASGVVSGVSMGATKISYTLPTGCFDTHYVTVAFNVGVGGVNGLTNITLAPNPNSGVFTLKGSIADATEQEADVLITNILGQVIYSNKIAVRSGELNERIELNNMPSGQYILSLKTGAETKVFQFVKE
jgi:Secretion system C-terminal sorting domain